MGDGNRVRGKGEMNRVSVSECVREGGDKTRVWVGNKTCVGADVADKTRKAVSDERRMGEVNRVRVGVGPKVLVLICLSVAVAIRRNVIEGLKVLEGLKVREGRLLIVKDGTRLKEGETTARGGVLVLRVGRRVRV
eukprot:CAMPEP_0184674430 /NCGR_PEP_ID=MMETSP0308-20130426/87233_1 /TAXON_ID=38269 /ORGANISM="Gloeochaete witrockiana, Strain SAG 46.84" /LENGTH=135 /DNA_ID=CAMNT_0027122029 /DNA_START=1941 /DNA_END=2348 /DNA_ORIENTATION=+